MRVLLIYPPINTNLPVRGSFPLGLGYITSALCDAGHEVKVLDLNIHGNISVADFLRDDPGKFDLIGISGMVTVYGYIKNLVGLIKEAKPDIPVIVGGSVASSMPEFFLEHTRADMVCVGEGENTVRELVSCLEKGDDLESVQGLCAVSLSSSLDTGQRGERL